MKSTSATLPLFAAVASVLSVLISVVCLTGSTTTEEERKQIEMLTGQLFVFDGVTNEIKRARSIAAFDGQHEMVPYLRLLAPYFEQYNWPKDRPVRILDQGDRIDVYWPFPPEIENQPFLFRPDCLYYSPIDKKEKKVITFGLGG